MNILFVTAYYPPEVGAGAHLGSELAQSLKNRGHNVSVVTAYPSYNLKVIPPRYRHGIRMNEVMDGITVQRIRLPSVSRTNRIARGMEHFMLGLWLASVALFAPRPDVIMVPSPPLPLAWAVSWVARLRRIPVTVRVQDLFPREAVELGMLTNPLIIRLLEAMERQVYRIASGVTVHSAGNRGHVLQRGGRDERVRVIYNWVDTERIQPGRRHNEFASLYGLADYFVVSYAGTMGWAQDMRTIITSAQFLRDQANILFLLVGDGVEKEKAQAKSNELGLRNILWLPMQPWSLYPEILAASDVSLINIHPDLRTPVVPSKLLSIMAAARPVLASLPIESDARLIIEESGCGICVDAGDGEALAVAIRKLASDPALVDEAGNRGRAYVEAHFSREASIGQIESALLRTLVPCSTQSGGA